LLRPFQFTVFITQSLAASFRSTIPIRNSEILKALKTECFEPSHLQCMCEASVVSQLSTSYKRQGCSQTHTHTHIHTHTSTHAHTRAYIYKDFKLLCDFDIFAQ